MASEKVAVLARIDKDVHRAAKHALIDKGTSFTKCLDGVLRELIAKGEPASRTYTVKHDLQHK